VQQQGPEPSVPELCSKQLGFDQLLVPEAVERRVERRFDKDALNRRVYLLRNEVDSSAFNRLTGTGDDLHRQALLYFGTQVGGYVDVGFEFLVLINRCQRVVGET